MKYKQWNQAASDPAAVAALEWAGLPTLAAMTLCARGLDTPEKARAFLDAGRGQLQDPMGMKDMDKAAARLARALAAGETVAVYGDYDVDGITSTSLLTDFLRREGGTVIPYIPDRMEEGYGGQPGGDGGLRHYRRGGGPPCRPAGHGSGDHRPPRM